MNLKKLQAQLRLVESAVWNDHMSKRGSLEYQRVLMTLNSAISNFDFKQGNIQIQGEWKSI